jgi:hypothetical protein
VACLLAWPSRTVRMVIYLSIAVILVLAVIPNGMGSNFARFVWFCIPVAVVARTRGRRVLLTLIIVPIVAVGGVGLVSDLRQASLPASSTNYYADLKAELAQVSNLNGYPDLKNYRVEVVDDGTHTADYALLNNAQLARGWETQSDLLLNKQVRDSGKLALAANIYKDWLLRNAVGYVALNRKPPKVTAEVALVSSAQPFLTQIWQNTEWALYTVVDPQPIVDLPAAIVGFNQNSLQIRVSCACTFVVRAYWNPNLTAKNFDPNEPDGVAAEDAVAAPAADGVKNWTQITTLVPGYYTLAG